MAADLRSSWPGVEVRINAPGRRKVSDMICLVAEPLLESAPDFESKQIIRRRSRELSRLRSDKLSQRVAASGVGSYSGV